MEFNYKILLLSFLYTSTNSEKTEKNFTRKSIHNNYTINDTKHINNAENVTQTIFTQRSLKSNKSSIHLTTRLLNLKNETGHNLTRTTEAKVYPSTRDLDFEERLDRASREHNNCYYNFVTRNGTEIYIRVRVKPKSFRNEVVDMYKGVALIDVKALGYGEESNKQVLDYIQHLLEVEPHQLEIVSGNTTEHKIIKLTGYRDTRFSVLYKFVDAWEALFFPTTQRFEDVMKKWM